MKRIVEWWNNEDRWWNREDSWWNLYKEAVGLLLLSYLIPFINVLFVVSNRERFKSATVSICIVLSSTAAASACIIKERNGRSGKIFYLRTVTLVCAVVSFMSSIVYEMMNFLCFDKELIIAFTAIANICYIWMYVIVNKKTETESVENKKI